MFRSKISLGLLTLLSAAIGVSSATAADITWNNGSSDFLWNTSSLNWGSGIPWNNNSYDGAVFGATGVGTITATGTINVRSINFGTNNGYTITGGTLNLGNLGSSSLGAGVINVGGTTGALTAVDATINSNITSTFGFTKTGDGRLTLGGTNTVTGFNSVTGSSLGVNYMIGSGTATTFGGSLRITNAAAVANASIGVGHGFLDLQTNVTLSNLTMMNTAPSSRTPTNQGVIGTGTITTQSIRVIGNSTGWGTTVNNTIDASGGILRVTVGTGSNGANEVSLLGPITNGSLLKTYGLSTSGAVSIGGFTLGGNNTYSGATVLNGSTSNNIYGTNASTSFTGVNGTFTVLGSSGSYSAATAVALVSNGNLLLSDTATVAVGSAPAQTAAVLNNRMGTTSNLTLDSGTLSLTAGTVLGRQTFNNVSTPSGFNRVNLVNGTAGTAEVLATGNLTMSPGSTLIVGGASVGTTATTTPTATRFVVNGSTPTAVNGLIPGLYTATSSGGAAATFARNSSNAGVGIVGLAITDYTNNAFGATLNSDLTTAQTLSTSTTANAIRSSVNITINAGQTLTVGAGGILSTAAITVGGTGTLAFGANPGILMVNSTTTTYSSAITGNSGLYKNGPGTITISGDLSGLTGGLFNYGVGTTNLNTATYAGPITVASGTLTTNSNIGAGGQVTLGTPNTPAGAVGSATTLNINTSTITNFARNIAVVGSDGTAPFAGTSGMVLTALSTANQTISGTIALGTHLSVTGTTTGQTSLTGVISGVGGLNITGGNVTISNAGNTFAGGMQINGGTTIGTVDAALGTGNINMLAGTLQTNYAGNFNRGINVMAASTLNTNGNNITMSGGINGENQLATFTRGGAGTTTITGLGNFPGTLAIASASSGAVTLSGASGALSRVTQVTIPTGTTFTLDNATTYNANRLNDDMNLSLGGGIFNYIAPASTTTDPAERIGVLTNTTAGSVFSIFGNAGATNGTILRFGSLNTTAGLTIRGDGLGNATLGPNVTRLLIDSFTTAQAIIPNVFFANTAGQGTSTTPAGYDLVRGIVLFTPTPVSGTSINNLAPDNVPLTAAYTTNGNATATTGVSVYSLVLDGGSTLTLNGGNAASGTNGNTPDGTLNLSGGVLTSQNGAKTIDSAAARIVSLGAVSGTVTTTSDLTLNANVTLSGTNSLTKLGTGTLTLNGPYAVTGTLDVQAGAIVFGQNSTVANLTGAGSVNIGTTTLTINNTTGSLFTGNMIGTTGGITKTGLGQLTFSPSASYTSTGTTNINGGTLVLGNANASGILSNFALSTGTIDLNGFNTPTGLPTTTGTANQLINSNNGTASTINFPVPTDTTLGASLGGNVIVNKTGAGNLTIGGTNATIASPTGVINVNEGTVTVASGTPVGAGMSFTVASGATMSYGSFGNNNTDAAAFGTLTVNGGNAIVNGGAGDLAINRTIFTGGSLSFTGSTNFWWHFRNANAGITTNASSSTVAFTGPTSGSRIQNDTATPLPIVIAAGTTASGIDLDNGIFMTSGGANSSFAKSGPGVMQLSYAGTNSASFIVNGGTIQVATGTTISGTNTVNSTGILRGVGTLSGATTVNNGGFVRGGTIASPLTTLTSSANITITQNGGIQSEADNSNTASLLNLTGTAVLNLNPGAGNTFVINILSNPGNPLVMDTAYTITLATVGTAGNIQLNGVSQTASTNIPASNFVLTSPQFSAFNNVSLNIDGAGTGLVLQFTPVPEPVTIIGVGLLTVAGAGWVRRRRAGQA